MTTQNESIDAMNLRLAHLEPSPVSQPQFSEIEGFTPEWWRGRTIFNNRHWYAFKDESDAEVARAEIEPNSTVGRAYPSVTTPREGFVEIEFIEVRLNMRGQGFGREAVNLLMDTYKGREFAAMSDGGDEFWTALGWEAHIHMHGRKCKLLFTAAQVSPGQRQR